MFRTIDLKSFGIPAPLEQAGFGFTFAEVLDAGRVPMAIVHFKQSNGAKPLGLRLDLDKQVFLDGVAGVDVQTLAPELSGFISGEAFPMPEMRH